MVHYTILKDNIEQGHHQAANLPGRIQGPQLYEHGSEEPRLAPHRHDLCLGFGSTPGTL